MRTLTIRTFRPSTDSSVTLTIDCPCYVSDPELFAREYVSSLLPSWEVLFVVGEKL